MRDKILLSKSLLHNCILCIQFHPLKSYHIKRTMHMCADCRNKCKFMLFNPQFPCSCEIHFIDVHIWYCGTATLIVVPCTIWWGNCSATTAVTFLDSKVYGANMGPIWGRQDPGGPHVGPMNLACYLGSSQIGRGWITQSPCLKPITNIPRVVLFTIFIFSACHAAEPQAKNVYKIHGTAATIS